MPTWADDELVELVSLRPVEGEVIVIKLHRNITRQEYEHLCDAWRKIYPNTRVFVLEGDADISLMPVEALRRILATLEEQKSNADVG